MYPRKLFKCLKIPSTSCILIVTVLLRVIVLEISQNSVSGLSINFPKSPVHAETSSKLIIKQVFLIGLNRTGTGGENGTWVINKFRKLKTKLNKSQDEGEGETPVFYALGSKNPAVQNLGSGVSENKNSSANASKESKEDKNKSPKFFSLITYSGNTNVLNFNANANVSIPQHGVQYDISLLTNQVDRPNIHAPGMGVNASANFESETFHGDIASLNSNPNSNSSAPNRTAFNQSEEVTQDTPPAAAEPAGQNIIQNIIPGQIHHGLPQRILHQILALIGWKKINLEFQDRDVLKLDLKSKPENPSDGEIGAQNEDKEEGGTRNDGKLIWILIPVTKNASSDADQRNAGENPNQDAEPVCDQEHVDQEFMLLVANINSATLDLSSISNSVEFHNFLDVLNVCSSPSLYASQR